MTGFIQDSLKAGTGFLQATLQGARAHMKHLRDCINGWTLPSQSVLNSLAYKFYGSCPQTPSGRARTILPAPIPRGRRYTETMLTSSTRSR